MFAGVWLLRESWRLRPRAAPSRMIAGWTLIMLGLAIFAWLEGAETGTTDALLALSLAGYAAVVASLERRTMRQRDTHSLAPEPEERPTNWPRAIAKSLLAIVLAGIAAIGIGVAFAIAMPIGTHDRIVIGGVLVPVLWGAGMAWTLADAKLVRATILLVAISAVSYAIAFLPKALPS
jgi:hypothetical protein